MHYGMVRALRALDASYKFPHCHSGNQKGCHLCPGIGVVKWPLMRTSGPTPSHSGYQGSPRSSWWPPGRSLVPCVGGCGLGKQEGEVSDIVLGIGVGVVGNNVRSFTNALGFVWRHSWTSPCSLTVHGDFPLFPVCGSCPSFSPALWNWPHCAHGAAPYNQGVSCAPLKQIMSLSCSEACG